MDRMPNALMWVKKGSMKRQVKAFSNGSSNIEKMGNGSIAKRVFVGSHLKG